MIDFKSKHILFIGIGFYDYELIIKDYLEKKGAIVYYFSSVFHSWQKKVCIRIGQEKLASKWSSNHVLDQIRKAPDNIDFILIIKAEDFRKEHVEAINEKYPYVPKTLYLWDSLVRLPNKDLLLDYFSNILTFDRRDAERYNLKFRPLFSRKIRKPNLSEVKYDLSFVGFMHSMRYDVLRYLRQHLDKENICYMFVLTTGRFNKWYNIKVTHKVRKEDADMLLTEPLPYDDYLNILSHSNVILDISHPKQSGLTMRTIEALCFGKKLLTTNEDIVNYSFNKSQFQVLNLEKGIDLSFLRDRNMAESDMRKYTLEQFVEDLFSM